MINFDLILECIEKSNAIWHSLCVLTTADFKDMKEGKLCLEKIQEICLNAELIMVGAYDGEGYIFWERSF